MIYHMGIDVGTTNIKAAAFDRDGLLVAFSQVPTPIVHPKEGLSELEPESIWRAVCSVVKDVVRHVGSDSIVSVGVSAMAESGVPLDRDGKPLYNFIAWYDMRSRPQCQSLISRMGCENVYALTGQTPSPKYGVTKLMWLKDEMPWVYERARRWLSMEDYMLYRLCGSIATDYSVAARTMAFDINRLTWSRELLEQADIDYGLFPEAVPGGALVGEVTRAASEDCALKIGTRVCTGGHDHACAAIAINILEQGAVLDSMGTGEVSMVAMNEARMNEGSLNSFYSIYPHCGRKLYRALTSNQSCGLTIDWFLRTFCPDMISREKDGGKTRYDMLFDEMRVDPDRHDGLYILPMIRGTVEQADMYGGFCGIRDIHDRGDFIASMIDGMLYEVRRQVDGYSRTFGEAYDKVRVVGGASSSAMLMQRKADVHNCLVQTPKVTQAACMGAAILSAVGAGYMNLDDASSINATQREYLPTKDRARQDEARFREYEKLRKLAMEANAAWRGEDKRL